MMVPPIIPFRQAPRSPPVRGACLYLDDRLQLARDHCEHAGHSQTAVIPTHSRTKWGDSELPKTINQAK